MSTVNYADLLDGGYISPVHLCNCLCVLREKSSGLRQCSASLHAVRNFPSLFSLLVFPFAMRQFLRVYNVNKDI